MGTNILYKFTLLYILNYRLPGIATVLVTRLEYSNFRFHSIANITNLQHSYNCLAKVVTWSPCFTCSMPLLKYCIGFLSNYQYLKNQKCNYYLPGTFM